MTMFYLQCKQHPDVTKRSNRNTPLSKPCKHHHHHHCLHHHHHNNCLGWGPQWNGGRGCQGHCPSCHRKEEGGDDDEDEDDDDDNEDDDEYDQAVRMKIR